MLARLAAERYRSSRSRQDRTRATTRRAADHIGKQDMPEVKKGRGWISAGALGLIVLAAILSVATEPRTPEEFRARLAEQPEAIEKPEAMSMCEKFVTQRVEPPGPIAFSSGSERTAVHDSTGHWRVTGYADVEDPEGATVRTRYTCEVTHASSDEWRLVDLTLE